MSDSACFQPVLGEGISGEAVAFTVDENSLSEARGLIKALRELQEKFELMHFEKGGKEQMNHLTEPLEQISREIPVWDIKADVQDFALLAAIAKRLGLSLPALPVGEGAVPLLPNGRMMLKLSWVLQYTSPDPFAVKGILRVLPPRMAKTVQLSYQKARKAFFDGLEPFLAHRIGGVRWWRKHRRQLPPGGLPSMDDSGRVGQYWCVHHSR